ncbi:MAG: hypothetical protein LBB89_06500 [Treponema sp.]|jgi:hypothetical protein|nr:hypothetical protein [Treponema sp.]
MRKSVLSANAGDGRKFYGSVEAGKALFLSLQACFGGGWEKKLQKDRKRPGTRLCAAKVSSPAALGMGCGKSENKALAGSIG